jgi:hypothetical protein
VAKIILHEEHESDAWHKSPVELADQLLVQSCHLLLTQVPERVEARLDLLGSDLGVSLGKLFELDVSLLLVGRDVRHRGLSHLVDRRMEL